MENFEVSFTHRMVYLINSVWVCLLPVYLFHSVFDMAIEDHAKLFAIVTAFSALILMQAYTNIASLVWHKLVSRRGKAITMATVKATTKQSDAQKAEGYQNVLASRKARQARAITSESVAFSVLFNNVFFLLCVVVIGFYFCRSMGPAFKYLTAVTFSSGLAATFSLSKK